MTTSSNMTNGPHNKDQLASSTDENIYSRLEKKLTLFNGVTIIVGCIIGSGIFVSPKGVLQEVGSVGASLVVWTVCGVVSLIGAYCYAELGCMIRDSGADYAYMYRAFGPFLAFLRLWVDIVIRLPCSYTISALTFAKYLVYPVFSDCEAPKNMERLLATTCILIITVVNCASVKLSAHIQNIFTIAKVLALMLIVITGIVQMSMGRVEHLQNIWDGTNLEFSKIALSLYSGLWAYTGWNNLNSLIEEMKNPKRDLPLAIVISCVICTVIYLCTIVAYHSLVSPAEMISTPAVAVLFARKVYGSFWWLVPLFVSMSTFGMINGNIFAASRMCYVGGRNGHMPSVLNMVQINRATPVPAVLFQAVISLIYLISEDVYALINYMGSVIWLSIGISVALIFYFRWKEPNLERPIKVWLGWPVLYLLFTGFLIIFAFVGSPLESTLGILSILSGIPFYVVGVMWKPQPKPLRNFSDSLTRFIQKLFIVTLEEREE